MTLRLQWLFVSYLYFTPPSLSLSLRLYIRCFAFYLLYITN